MPRTRKKETDNRSPLAKARDDFFAAHPEITDPITLGVPRKNRQFLENRLARAFLAGADAMAAHRPAVPQLAPVSDAIKDAVHLS